MLHPDTPLSIGEIERATKLAYASVQSALRTLEKHRLAIRDDRAGRAVYMPDRDSPYYPMAYAVALVDLPIDDALHRQNVYAVYAYGSMAKAGGGSRTSDIDLLIVGDVRQPDRLREELGAAGVSVGRRIDPLILSPEQMDRGRADGDSHVLAALGGVRLRGGLE